MSNKKEPNYCIFCGNPLTGKKRRNRFCNAECFSSYRKKLKWAEFEKNNDFKNAFHTTIRKYLKEKNGNQCSICGIEKWENKEIVFIVDHIDGYSTNTKINNCRLICPNCDSQLPTFKGKNAGRGRFNRR